MRANSIPLGLFSIVNRIVGGSDGLHAQFRAELERAEDLSGDLEFCGMCGSTFNREYLEKVRNDTYEGAQKIYREIELYNRLLDPELMSEVYEWLEPFDENEWALFVLSATQARMDFAEFRRMRAKAARLASDAEKLSAELQKTVSQLRDTGVLLPEFLMPQYRDDDIGEYIGGSQTVRYAKWKILLASGRKKEQPQETLVDAVRWLSRMQKEAKSIEVQFACPAITAAISKRQNSKKSAYLRAFGALLTEVSIALTPSTMKAMAVTATVVMGDPEFDATEDDVRKAIGRVTIKRKTQRQKPR